MTNSLNPAAPHHLPPFITAPGETDVLMVVMGIFLLLAVLAFGVLFFRLHTLPERLAHKSQKIQFEIVAVMGLIALFTHMHIFWIGALLLALIDVPDFSTPLRRIAGSAEKMAGLQPGEGVDMSPGAIAVAGQGRCVEPASVRLTAHAASKASEDVTLPDKPAVPAAQKEVSHA